MPHTPRRTRGLRCGLSARLGSRIRPRATCLIVFYPATTDLASVLAFLPNVMLFQSVVGFGREIEVDCNRSAAFCSNATNFLSVRLSVGSHFERSYRQPVRNVISICIGVNAYGSSLRICALNLYLRSSKWFAVHTLYSASNRGVLCRRVRC